MDSLSRVVAALQTLKKAEASCSRVLSPIPAMRVGTGKPPVGRPAGQKSHVSAWARPFLQRSRQFLRMLARSSSTGRHLVIKTANWRRAFGAAP